MAALASYGTLHPVKRAASAATRWVLSSVSILVESQEISSGL